MESVRILIPYLYDQYDTYVMNLSIPTYHGRDIHNGGVRCINDSIPTRQAFITMNFLFMVIDNPIQRPKPLILG